jgi:hypothetical protein
MAWTIESALQDKHITQVRRLSKEFKFQLGMLNPWITIRLYEVVGGNGYEWTQSHYIKTPSLASAYQTSRPWGDDEAYALHLAVSTLTRDYGLAVSAGHTPSDEWLVPNEDF